MYGTVLQYILYVSCTWAKEGQTRVLSTQQTQRSETHRGDAQQPGGCSTV